MRELFQVFGIVVPLIVCFVFGIHVLIANDCEAYATITGRATKMQTMTCYVKHNDQWFTQNEFTALITANGELIHE